MTDRAGLKSSLSGVSWDAGARPAPLPVTDPAASAPARPPDVLPHLQAELAIARDWAWRWLERAEALAGLVEHVADLEAELGRPVKPADLKPSTEEGRARFASLVERAFPDER